MNTPSTTSVDTDLTVDTVAVCECWTLKGIKVDDSSRRSLRTFLRLVSRHA
jgi:hypothetical protein